MIPEIEKVNLSKKGAEQIYQQAILLIYVMHFLKEKKKKMYSSRAMAMILLKNYKYQFKL